MDTYITGTVLRARVAFTTRKLTAAERTTFEATGALPVGIGVDPATVTFNARSSGGITVGPYTFAAATVTKSEVGSYYVDLPLSATARWAWRFVATGAGAAAGESEAFAKSEFV